MRGSNFGIFLAKSPFFPRFLGLFGPFFSYFFGPTSVFFKKNVLVTLVQSLSLSFFETFHDEVV